MYFFLFASLDPGADGVAEGPQREIPVISPPRWRPHIADLGSKGYPSMPRAKGRKSIAGAGGQTIRPGALARCRVKRGRAPTLYCRGGVPATDHYMVVSTLCTLVSRWQGSRPRNKASMSSSAERSSNELCADFRLGYPGNLRGWPG